MDRRKFRPAPSSLRSRPVCTLHHSRPGPIGARQRRRRTPKRLHGERDAGRKRMNAALERRGRQVCGREVVLVGAGAVRTMVTMVATGVALGKYAGTGESSERLFVANYSY